MLFENRSGADECVEAIVLDAGSSGTRIFVYRWRGCVGIEGYPILPDDINLPHGWGSAKSEADGGMCPVSPSR